MRSRLYHHLCIEMPNTSAINRLYPTNFRSSRWGLPYYSFKYSIIICSMFLIGSYLLIAHFVILLYNNFHNKTTYPIRFFTFTLIISNHVVVA